MDKGELIFTINTGREELQRDESERNELIYELLDTEKKLINIS